MRTISLLSVCILILSAAASPLMAADDDEKIQSLKEERKNILLYGIDSQVSELIDSLKTEKDNSFSPTLHEILLSSVNTNLQVKILDFFSETNYDKAHEDAYNLLLQYEDGREELILSLMRYLKKDVDKKVMQLLTELSTHEKDSIAVAAIDALGKAKDRKRAGEGLLELFNDDEVSGIRKQNIILAFGELAYEPARDELIEIVEDEDEDKAMRWYACDALGKIAHKDDIGVIKALLSDKDEILKSYAVSALSRFPGKEINEILIATLRESSPKIRISAAKTLGERKEKDAVPILRFKAEKDPDAKVKEEAVRALGLIGGRDSYEFLSSLFLKENIAQNLRLAALKGMLDIDLGKAIKSSEELMAKEWTKKDSKILDPVCQELSLREHPSLEKPFSQMLSHPGSITIQIYGIRGIARNGFKGQRSAVEDLSKNSKSSSVKKAALSALDEL